MTRRLVNRAMLHKAASSLSWDRSASRPLDSEEQVESVVYCDLASGAVESRGDAAHGFLDAVQHGKIMVENVSFT